MRLGEINTDVLSLRLFVLDGKSQKNFGLISDDNSRTTIARAE